MLALAVLGAAAELCGTDYGAIGVAVIAVMYLLQMCIRDRDMAQGAGDAGVGELARLQKIREFLCGRELKAAVSHPRRQIFPHLLESCQSFPWQ